LSKYKYFRKNPAGLVECSRWSTSRAMYEPWHLLESSSWGRWLVCEHCLKRQNLCISHTREPHYNRGHIPLCLGTA